MVSFKGRKCKLIDLELPLKRLISRSRNVVASD
jgi:hypothetical protein